MQPESDVSLHFSRFRFLFSVHSVIAVREFACVNQDCMDKKMEGNSSISEEIAEIDRNYEKRKGMGKRVCVSSGVPR